MTGTISLEVQMEIPSHETASQQHFGYSRFQYSLEKDKKEKDINHICIYELQRWYTSDKSLNDKNNLFQVSH